MTTNKTEIYPNHNHLQMGSKIESQSEYVLMVAYDKSNIVPKLHNTFSFGSLHLWQFLRLEYRVSSSR